MLGGDFSLKSFKKQKNKTNKQKRQPKKKITIKICIFSILYKNSVLIPSPPSLAGFSSPAFPHVDLGHPAAGMSSLFLLGKTKLGFPKKTPKSGESRAGSVRNNGMDPWSLSRLLPAGPACPGLQKCTLPALPKLWQIPGLSWQEKRAAKTLLGEVSW